MEDLRSIVSLNCEFLMNHFKDEGLLECEAVDYIVAEAQQLMFHEPNVPRIHSPAIGM